MTNVEFKELLTEAFKAHTFMRDRNYHTVNELLYVLEHDTRFKGTDFNISLSKLNSGWWSIPGLDAFVDVHTRGMWFNDDTVEFEIDEFELEGNVLKTNCITIYEKGDK